jgi:hypothetical protein
MSAAQRSHGRPDSPEVAALRKRLRGEPLTAEEEAILARTYRTPTGPTVPRAAVMAEFAERERRGG